MLAASDPVYAVLLYLVAQLRRGVIGYATRAEVEASVQ